MQFCACRLFLLRGMFDRFAFLLLDAEQFADIILQVLLLGYSVAIEFLCRNVSGFRAVDPALQSVFSHCCGIGVLVFFQLDTRHYIIGTQPRPSRGFRAVSPFIGFVCFHLSEFATFARNDGNDRRVDMRRRFVHVQYSRNDVFGSERLPQPLEVIGTPRFQSPFLGDTLHILLRAGQHDTDYPHLIRADLTGQSGMFESMVDCLRSVGYTL